MISFKFTLQILDLYNMKISDFYVKSLQVSKKGMEITMAKIQSIKQIRKPKQFT